ncbi:MAG: caspase family protein [Nostoc sp.]|uniref:caspase family protein n=1 Tax=Nostoc sp. TaxID=1180 RepID=UPI002FF8C9C7
MTQSFKQGYAVIVGVGADLPVTIDDATAVANLLRNSSRCAYPTEQVRLLTAEEANATNILSALSWLADVTGKDDTVIVYFSGHGMETPDYYLMPYGYNLGNLQGTAILGSTFTQHLQAIQVQKLLVILDCCHAGGQAEAKGAIKSPLPPSAITQLGNSSGRVILASSRKDEVSWTGQPYSINAKKKYAARGFVHASIWLSSSFP